MIPKQLKHSKKKIFPVQIISLFILTFISLSSALAELGENNIPPDTQIQSPTRFVWSRNTINPAGRTENQLAQDGNGNFPYYSSYQGALESLRFQCTENGGAWLCQDNEPFPGYDEWAWGFMLCRQNDPTYCVWQAASQHGVCPANLTGYSIESSVSPTDFGYIACPVPTYPDGEKDLAKLQECGERTPNPVHIGLGRKEITVPVYSTGNGSFPIDFQLYYQHNDKKRASITWRHTYYKYIVLDGQEVPTSARVYRGKGALLFNKDQTTGEWQSDDDINDLLIEVFDSNEQRTGWVYVDRFTDRVENYDTAGKLISIEDRSGLKHTLTYNSSGNLINVADSFGQQIQFTHDDRGNFATLLDSAGSLYQFTYSIARNLTSVIYPDGKVRSYHYNEPVYTGGASLPNALTGITDENGIRYATYTYDTQGRAIVTELAGGTNQYMLAYSPDGSNTVVTDPLGSQYTHQFQNILGVAKSVSQSQPAGAGCSAASSATTYDVNGNVASRTDFNGNKTCFAFDLNRNLEIARVEGLAAGSVCPSDLVNYTPAANSSERKTLTSWHVDFRLPTLVTEAQRETNFNYDTYGNVTLLSIRDTASNETRTWNTSYIYHPTVPGVITQRIENGPRTDVSDITTINYYAPDENCVGGHMGCRGQVSNIANALGHVTHITRYNAHGQPEVILDPNGLSTTLVYDTRQRLISRTTGTEITDYLYDSVGQVTSIKFPDNSFLTYTYDDAHRLTEIADSLNNRIQYTLDAMGNRIKEEVFDPANTLTQTQEREFDALSRLWKNIGAQSQTTEFGYDANGNLKQATNPLQHTTTNSFDA